MAANNANLKYRIDRPRANFATMVATQAIKVGEEIIAEAPLLSLPAGLARTYDAERVLSERSKFSAAPHMQAVYNGKPQHVRQAIDALHNEGPGLASRFATNAFSQNEDCHGHEYVVIRLFNDISRANHSCRPNAVWNWRPDTEKSGKNDQRDHFDKGVGTLYALRHIANGDEIWVDYLGDPDLVLRDSAHRKALLNKHYGFDCRCPACNSGPDSTHRRRAKKLWNQVFSDEVSPTAWPEHTNVEKIEQTEKLITELQDHLNLRDCILARAFEKLRDLQNEAADMAGRARHQDTCEQCRGKPTLGARRAEHMTRATNAFREANIIHIRCSGVDHPDLANDRKMMDELAVKLDRARVS